MINLSKKLKKKQEARNQSGSSSTPKFFNFRDKLLPNQVNELTADVLPSTASVWFPDVDILHKFKIVIKPSEGYWKDGRFEFDVEVPEDYNMSPPKVRCRTTLWHPNINYSSGEVCLSLLRKSAVDDGMGWTPARSLKDIVLGLDGLFGDLVNFDDPLNQDAAQDFSSNPERFQRKVSDHVRRFAQ